MRHDLKLCPKGIGPEEKQPMSFGILSLQVTKKKKKDPNLLKPNG